MAATSLDFKTHPRISPILCVALALVLGAAGFAEESRVWTSKKNGRQFKGVLVEAGETAVSIRRDSDGVLFEVKKSDLTQADLDWIEQQAPESILDLSDLISGVPGSTGTPAVGVVLIDEGQTRGLGASGLRKIGDATKVGQMDKWHLGSCSKSMTSTLAASLVEEGIIGWETTIDEVLGKEMKMLEAYASVTLGVLVANRSGLPRKTPDSAYAEIDVHARIGDLRDREIMKQRAKFVEAVLDIPPAFQPGSGYEYSNAGFVVAGAMMEQVTGKPWERLIEERLFKPLGMTKSGFGNAAQADRRKPTQPWPHKSSTVPVPPGAGDDNSWVLGPAATVHCSLPDVARYMAMHAGREIGPVLKEKESFEFLHKVAPQNENYARGWIVARTPWSHGPAITHDGSNTMNHCSLWIAPERKAAVAAFTNCAENGRESCMSAIRLVAEKYLRDSD